MPVLDKEEISSSNSVAQKSDLPQISLGAVGSLILVCLIVGAFLLLNPRKEGGQKNLEQSTQIMSDKDAFDIFKMNLKCEELLKYLVENGFGRFDSGLYHFTDPNAQVAVIRTCNEELKRSNIISLNIKTLPQDSLVIIVFTKENVLKILSRYNIGSQTIDEDGKSIFFIAPSLSDGTTFEEALEAIVTRNIVNNISNPKGNLSKYFSIRSLKEDEVHSLTSRMLPKEGQKTYEQ